MDNLRQETPPTKGGKMPDEKKDSPSESEKQEEKEQEGLEESGSSKTKTDTEAPLKKTPEKLKGKSAEEITKMYLEAEKKIGEQSTSVAEAKKLKEQTDVMLKAIWSDPDLYRKVESGINTYLSGEKLPDTRKKTKPKKGGEEAKGTEMSPEVADIRKATENRILGEFRSNLGYNNLPAKESQEKFTKTAVVLAELLDPSGKKSVKEIVAGVPLDRLPKYLRYAHRIAHSADAEKQATRSALASAEENKAASIGSFPASSGKAKGKIQLSNRERKTALAMGISEEDYAKQKALIEKDRKKYE